MKHEIHDKMDNLFTEIYNLQERQLNRTHLTPATIVMYQEKLVKLILGECHVALNTPLRDMISRGKAYDLIKGHFNIKEAEE